MKRATAMISGFVAASLTPALLLATAESLAERTIAGLALIPVFLFFSVPATLLGGAPAFLILNRFNLVQWWSAVGVGSLIGVLMGLILKQDAYSVAAMAAVGMVSGLSFWLVWKQGR